MKKIGMWVMLLLLGWAHSGWGQQPGNLAEEYYRQGQYEKAADQWANVVREPGASWMTVYKYVNSLLKSGKTDDAQRFLKRQSKSDAERAYLYEALRGYVVKTQGDSAQANATFEAARKLAKSRTQKETAAEAFVQLGEPDRAIQTYQTLRSSGQPTDYSTELAELYKATAQTDAWINELLLTSQIPEQRDQALVALQAFVNTKDEELLEKRLYENLQKDQNNVAYNEILSWFYTQKQRFGRALIQEKAVDRRMRLNGARVFELGQMALNNQEYKAATDAFEYVVQNYPNGQLYPYARRLLINAREEQVKRTYPVQQTEITKLIADYRRMLQEVGVNNRTLDAMRNMAGLYAQYLNKTDSALAILETAITWGKNNPNFVDRCKLDKGDLYLFRNEPWEATLLYSQVEKSQKEEPLGYEAKLRNAKLHYYVGNFTLAKELLDILNLATSREIANDAGQLSLLILDNTGLDTTETALREYASADLLLFQNQLDQALTRLNDLKTKYATHSLADEILWLRANTYLKQNRVVEAQRDLAEIVERFGTDILGDDALFLQAKVAEEREQDKEKAMTLYQKVLTTYPSSVFSAEARKRFRQLRGDTIN